MAEGSEGVQPKEAEFRISDCRREIDLRYQQTKGTGWWEFKPDQYLYPSKLRFNVESWAAITPIVLPFPFSLHSYFLAFSPVLRSVFFFFLAIYVWSLVGHIKTRCLLSSISGLAAIATMPSPSLCPTQSPLWSTDPNGELWNRGRQRTILNPLTSPSFCPWLPSLPLSQVCLSFFRRGRRQCACLSDNLSAYQFFPIGFASDYWCRKDADR